jgi:hypothetical protein
MRMNNEELWDQLRAAYRPPAPEIDTAAIMGAVRREAAAHPLRRAKIGLATPIPTWVCAAAACLALLAAASVVGRSISDADRQISQAWMQSVPPDEFVQNFIPFADDSSL